MWILACVLGSLLAQDVTVAPLQWMEPEEAPDQLPDLGRPYQLKFPDELKKTPDFGWVIMDLSLDAKGAVTYYRLYATQPGYRKAFEAEGRERRKFKAGRRAGKAVNTRVRLTAVFNPASAAVDKPDATPRLLDANRIVVPGWERKEDDPREVPEVVWGTVSLDTHGAAVAVEEVPAELAPLLAEKVREWRFAPARRDGVPIAATVRVPFILVPREDAGEDEGDPPRLIKRVPPAYPVGMRESGLRAEVTLEFVVDIEGRPRHVVAVKSLNPAFDQIMIDMVRQWRYEPARVAGRPVSKRMQLTFGMGLHGEPEGGRGPLDVRQRANMEALPPELRYETEPKLVTMERPKYPHALLQAGAQGSAEVALVIDARGKVAASKVTEATHPEFGLALQAAVARFEYEPALKDGRPSQAVIRFTQKFDLRGSALVAQEDKAALEIEQKHPERILRPGQLDGKLIPVLTRLPRLPAAQESNSGGQAVIEIVVDREGRAVLPRIVSASTPELGYAAVQAVATWRFEPPLSQGKPAMTRAQVPFTFKASAARAQEGVSADEKEK